MEESVKNVEESATTMNTTEQDEAEKLTLSEKEIQKEVERLLQDELDKFLAGEEAEAQKEREGVTLQDEGEKPVMEEETKEEKDHLSLQADKVPKFLEIVEEEEEEEEEIKQESDSLTLLGDDELKVMEDEEETKEESDSLTLLGDDELKVMEDEEETNGESDHLTLKVEGEEPSEKQKTERVKFSDAVLKIIKQRSEKAGQQSRGSIGSLWARHRQKIKEAAHKQRIAMLPPGYFAKLGKVLDLPAFQELKALEWGSRARKWDPNPRLARMFPTETPDDQSKKITWKRMPPGEDHLPRLSSVMSEDVFGLQDRDLLAKAGEPEEEVQPSSISRSPESITSKSEILVEPKKEDAEAAAKTQDTQAKKLLCESFYSYPGLASSVWNMGQRISHWRLAHHRGYQADQFSQDKMYKQRLLKHEREIKAAVPLPLQEVIEEEVMAILTDTLEDYQKRLGVEHPLTKQMEYQVVALQIKLQSRGVL